MLEVGEAEHRPERLGRYEIVGNLACGGMAEVLLARLTGRSGFEKVVAIKRILPRYVEEKSFVDMFLDEARIAAGINHPNVVQYLELGEEGGELFLVMEYLEGESLASIQRRARSRRVEVDYADAAHVVAQAAAGLHAAHELCDANEEALGVVHRDVSPQNVFVSYEGTTKVMDFGIAKAAGRITQTEAGELKGKFSYMSPEQAAGVALDRRSDVFSLGIVLYELTTGRRLFRRPSATATLRAVQDCHVEAPSSLRDAYPKGLERVCLKALAREPSGRYPTAEAMRSDLLAVLPELGQGALPEQGLRELLGALFEDRIEEKKEMLRRVRAGSDITQLPPAEVDRDVEIPSVEIRSFPHTKTRGTTRWWLVAAALGAVALGVGLALFGGGESEGSANVQAEELDEPITPEESETVDIHIESDPTGATVSLAGTGVVLGTCPIHLSPARGSEREVVVLSLEGHEPAEVEYVPSDNQRLRLVLRPTPPAETAVVSPRGSRPNRTKRSGMRTSMRTPMGERTFPIL